uniref:GAGA-binding transcriptional activator n=1 Tax=Araucaria cunninghamii TaxID=56994 RepID=A0A0D6QY34_ARACU
MEDEGSRLDFRHWDTLEKSLKDHPGLKVMSVLADRDAAILERNTAFAEKKAAYAEREPTILQGDVLYADRNSVTSDRGAAVAALDYARDSVWNTQRSLSCGTLSSAKILQVLADTPFLPREYQTLRPVSAPFPTSVLEASQSEEPQNIIRHEFKIQEGEKERLLKRKCDGSEIKSQKPKKQRKQACKTEEVLSGEVTVKNEKKNLDVVINGIVFDISTMPIPVCSCTGVPQQCYKWGNGGWQSACCTTNISMYPLPMNPKRRGARVAGRKMSGGAFRKLLERLGSEGHHLIYPIDLKSHWAKHGTNKFVTIR